MTDKIPDFGTHPTVRSVASGNWSNPAIWSTGAVPTAGAIVDIMSGNTVIFDLANSPTYNTVEVQNGGDLNFRTNASSTLNVGNLEVLQGGCFCIGTADCPDCRQHHRPGHLRGSADQHHDRPILVWHRAD